jgi:endonuclease YncB( thermonuclease family)
VNPPDSDRDISALRHSKPEDPFRLPPDRRRGAALSIALGAGLLLALASAAADTASIRGSPEVVDARRMVIADHEIVLADIAAPALGEACLIGGNRLDCGRLARAGLIDIVVGGKVDCSPVGQRRHRCFADGFDVGFGLIHAGWAVPADDAPAHYEAKMIEAKERGRGLWSAIPEAGEGPSVAHRLQR